MKSSLFATCILAFGASGVSHAADDITPADQPEPGQVLFETHGCSNCHGPDGVHPEAKYVPILRGKSADYLLKQANAIFSGADGEGRAHFMHDQFCIGETPNEGCYPLPSALALREIADWLGGAVEPAGEARTPQGLSVSAAQAYEQLQALGERALFIDIRTRAEVAFLGMPTDADANIPYMTAGNFDEWDEAEQTFKLRPNSEFTSRVSDLAQVRGLDQDAPIYLICRSGSRSAKAANILDLAGYRKVYTITDGYEGAKAEYGLRKGERVVNGWKNAGLPWSYRLNKTAMYWDL